MADSVDDPFADWRSLQLGEAPGTAVPAPERAHGHVPRADRRRPSVPELLPGPGPHVDPDPDVARSIAVLDDPRLVVTSGYIGTERRRPGVRAHVGRATWASRRRLLRLDLLIVFILVTMVLGALLLVSSGGQSAPTAVPAHRATEPAAGRASVSVSVSGATADVPRFGSRRATTVPPSTVPATTVPATTVPPSTVPAASATPATTDAQAGAAPGTPESMGAAALAMVRYPWQQISGYSIVFRSINDAPSPGFYGNTTFTWGSAGGVSTLYVYPGETVEHLAGIIAFEIAHEVDAAYVEPRGGHDAIASLLGIHPASWAPQCDCAEQGYLSGWYAAAFSDYWSPGVGAWSSLAPLPSGAALVAMAPWLDPRVP